MLHLWIFVCITLVDFTEAPVAELVDAADLKSVDRKVVPVQVRPPAFLKSIKIVDLRIFFRVTIG